MSAYKSIDLHKKKSDVLVIHCSDPRFQDAYHFEVERIDRYHYLLVVPGASKAVTDNPSIAGYVKLLHDLHHFNEVHIFDHIDCGAFGPIADEIKAHSASLTSAAEKLKKSLPEVKVEIYLLGQ